MRNLPPKLKEHFDQYFFGQGLFVLDPTEMLVKVAESCIGVTEIGGENKGPMIELFQDSVGVAQGQPWCVDFMQACIAYVEQIRSVTCPLPVSQGAVDLWNRSKTYYAASPARVGDLILWRIGNTGEGHCGIVTGSDSLTYSTIEGNTSDSSGIDRDGDGVFAKRRARGGSKTFIELGFLRVFV